MNLALRPSQCEAVLVNIASNAVWEVPAAIVLSSVALWRLWRWLRPHRARDAAAGPGTATGLTTPALAPETLARLRDLMLALPRWTESSRARRNFVTIALGKGHPVLGHIDWGGSARDVAQAVVAACAEQAGTDGGPPLCTLLAAIPREFGAKPQRDLELADLAALIGCP